MRPATVSALRDPRGALLKAAVVVPHLIIAALIWLVILAALPSAIAWTVVVGGSVTLALLAVGVAEGLAVRILCGGRRPTREEERGLAAPLRLLAGRVDTTAVLLRVRPRGRPVDAAGRRHVVLTRQVVDAHGSGRLSDQAMAELLAEGISRLRWGHTRYDLACLLWTAPWDFILGLIVGTGRLFAWLPLVGFAWKTRFVVGAIAVVLETQAGRQLSAVVIGAFITLTYALPRLSGAWERHLKERMPVGGSGRGPRVGHPGVVEGA